jgi:superoxide reductase
MKELKLLFCKHCGKIVELLPETHCCQTICCGEPMVELKANTTEATVEKHIPVVTVNGNDVKVTVGSVLHPMLPEHYIMYIYLLTNKHTYRADLKPGDAPVAEFRLLDDEKVEIAYAYCNIHGLWSTK